MNLRAKEYYVGLKLEFIVIIQALPCVTCKKSKGIESLISEKRLKKLVTPFSYLYSHNITLDRSYN